MKMSLLGLEPESMVRVPESNYKGVWVGALGYCVRARVYDRTYGLEPEDMV